MVHTEFRLLITGWRFWPRSYAGIIYKHLEDFLENHVQDGQTLVVVDGACPYDGVDTYAHEWAERQKAAGLPVRSERYRAPFSTEGRAAGPRRNQLMVDLGADRYMAFPELPYDPAYTGPARSGTHDCIRKARAAGIVGDEYPYRIPFQEPRPPVAQEPLWA